MVMRHAPADRDDAWWCAPLAQTLTDLDALPAGLGSANAGLRLARFGSNQFVSRPARPLWIQYLTHFGNPLVLVLLGASVLNAATGELAGSLIVIALVVASVTVDFVQEVRAGRVAEELRATVAVRARVVRDGRELDVPVADVVQGDVVLLAAGDLVPADGRVLEARDFFVHEANLTGEAYPVEKHPGELGGDVRELGAAPQRRLHGYVGDQRLRAVLVCRTGGRDRDGPDRRQPARDRAADRVRDRHATLRPAAHAAHARLLVLFVLAVNLVSGKPWPQAFLFAVALAVGLTPELLPMVVSVTLAAGAVRMARRGVVVRRLAAIHNLGAMDVLCTDKTGTLTEARIRLERHVDAAGRESERVLELAYLNSFFETGLRSPLDEAILAHTHIDASGWTKIDEVPFDFERRRVSVLIEDAPCAAARRQGRARGHRSALGRLRGSRPRPAVRRSTRRHGSASSRCTMRSRTRASACSASRTGRWAATIRTPWSATRPPSRCAASPRFSTRRRSTRARCSRLLAARGVAVKIVTGDNERVTRHVCGMLGLEDRRRPHRRGARRHSTTMPSARASTA